MNHGTICCLDCITKAFVCMGKQQQDQDQCKWINELLEHCEDGEIKWEEIGLQYRYVNPTHCPTCANKFMRVFDSEEIDGIHQNYFKQYGPEFEKAMKAYFKQVAELKFNMQP